MVLTRKAVLPVAGLGTRFVPATKAVPKPLLPVVDTPALQYVVEEAAAAGLTDLLLVTGRGQDAMLDHFDSAPQLEAALEKKGDLARLEAVRRPGRLARVSSIRQPEPRGLGDAVLMGRVFVGDEPFAVLLGDEFFAAEDRLLAGMCEVQGRTGGVVLALLEVPAHEISRYGCAAVEPGPDGTLRVTALVEKPAPAEAPSRWAVMGRYVLPPEIFAELERTGPGAGGEVQLTDAMAGLLAAGTPVHGVPVTGRRYDTGDRLEYLQTVVELACRRPDLGPPLRTWLAAFLAGGDDRDGRES